MFESTHPFLLFDYFRVPWRKATGPAELLPDLERRSLARLTVDGPGRTLYWPVFGSNGASPGEFRLDSMRLFARVLPDSRTAALLSGLGAGWAPSNALLHPNGERAASVWRDEQGNTFLPFDPSEVIQSFWTEAYAAGRKHGRLEEGARRAYYRMKPLFPRALQIGARRAFTHVQERQEFPSWPIEPALHDFYRWLMGVVTHVAGRPVPTIAPWPAGYRWALILTHDVEGEKGYRNLDVLRQVELTAGLRSCWNFVAESYRVEDELVAELGEQGFEVGVHGLYHDGLDLDSLKTLRRRLPRMHQARDRWGAVGFRAPALHRESEWMSGLGFDYDSSYPDTDPYSPKSGGCCSWLPFFNRGLVELPVTLAQDHTLFVILGHQDETMWTRKASFLRDRGGMALLITHPDYVTEGPALGAYERFLACFSDDSSAWRPLPREASAWWRRRADSRLELVRGEWRVLGPASGEASIELAGERRRAA
jgi:hypothetical protein